MRTSVPAPPTPTQTAPSPPVSEQGAEPVSMRATTCALPDAPRAATTITPATRMLLQKATNRLIRTPFRRMTECRLEARLATVKVHIGTDLVDQSSQARELLVELDRSASATLSSQLEGQLRSAVRNGRLKPGTTLPSTRALAAQLGVSRGLVVGAYAQLGAEGYLLLRRGASPRVARVAALPEPAAAARDRPAGAQPAARPARLRALSRATDGSPRTAPR